jgi:hypothetical protein
MATLRSWFADTLLLLSNLPVQYNRHNGTPQRTVLPYVRGVSEPLRRILAPLRVRMCFKPLQTLTRESLALSRPKDPIPDLQKSSVVYKIPCACCPASYVGQTSRRLGQWLEEHKRQADFNSSALIIIGRTCLIKGSPSGLIRCYSFV